MPSYPFPYITPPAQTMDHIFHRFPKSTLPVVARGEGMFVYDTDGNEYLDACGGAAVSCLGHSDPDVKRAIVDQLDRIPFAHTAFYTSDAAEMLANRLTAMAPGNLDRVYFVSGGSEATETVPAVAPSTVSRLARWQQTAISGAAQFDSLLFETHHIASCYEYRGRSRSAGLF